TLINRAVTPASRGMSLTPRSGGPSSFSSSAYSLSVWVSAADSPLGGETSSTLVGPPAAAGDAPHISSAAHTVTTPSPDVSRRNPPFHHSRIRTPTRPADPRAARPRAACHFWYTARAAGVPTEPRRESASYRATEQQSHRAAELASPGRAPSAQSSPAPSPAPSLAPPGSRDRAASSDRAISSARAFDATPSRRSVTPSGAAPDPSALPPPTVHSRVGPAVRCLPVKRWPSASTSRSVSRCGRANHNSGPDSPAPP